MILSRISTLPITPDYLLPSSLHPKPKIPTVIDQITCQPTPQDFESRQRQRVHETLQVLIGEYLSHCGYDQTASSFRSQVKRERQDRAEGVVPNASVEVDKEDDEVGMRVGGSSAELRGKILACVSGGRTQEALELLQDQFPSVLSIVEGTEVEKKDREELIFKLRSRVFVEAVLEYSRSETSTTSSTLKDIKGKNKSQDDEDHEMSSSSSSIPPSIDSLLLLGRNLHSVYSHHSPSTLQSELQATLGLMAYQDPLNQVQKGTRSYAIVTGQDLERTVETLNRAILSKPFSSFSRVRGCVLIGSFEWSRS